MLPALTSAYQSQAITVGWIGFFFAIALVLFFIVIAPFKRRINYLGNILRKRKD